MKGSGGWSRLTGRASLLLLLAMAFQGVPVATGASVAHAEKRTLKLYYTHTKEKGEFTYKKNGRFVRSELKRLNTFLRDWRRNEPTKMDPELFDIIWQVYRQSGSKGYIHIVSAYRSPKTNAMLRKRSRGVAKRSQHTLGKAMDFYIPGANLAKLRAAGLRLQRGGVGYYPKSGSPFVHMDTGKVRHWPRMTRKQLVKVFPKGGTLHVPSDGKPLPGYQTALAKYKKGGSAAIAYIDDVGQPKIRPGKLIARLFGAEDEAEDNAEVAAPTVAVASAMPDSFVATTAPALDALAGAPLPRPAPGVSRAMALAALAEANGEEIAPAVKESISGDAGLVVASLGRTPRLRPGETNVAISGDERSTLAALTTQLSDKVLPERATLASVSDAPEEAIDPDDRIALAYAAAGLDDRFVPDDKVDALDAINALGVAGTQPRARPDMARNAGTASPRAPQKMVFASLLPRSHDPAPIAEPLDLFVRPSFTVGSLRRLTSARALTTFEDADMMRPDPYEAAMLSASAPDATPPSPEPYRSASLQ